MYNIENGPGANLLAYRKASQMVASLDEKIAKNSALLDETGYKSIYAPIITELTEARGGWEAIKLGAWEEMRYTLQAARPATV